MYVYLANYTKCLALSQTAANLSLEVTSLGAFLGSGDVKARVAIFLSCVCWCHARMKRGKSSGLLVYFR